MLKLKLQHKLRLWWNTAYSRIGEMGWFGFQAGWDDMPANVRLGLDENGSYFSWVRIPIEVHIDDVGIRFVPRQWKGMRPASNPSVHSISSLGFVLAASAPFLVRQKITQVSELFECQDRP